MTRPGRRPARRRPTGRSGGSTRRPARPATRTRRVAPTLRTTGGRRPKRRSAGLTGRAVVLGLVVCSLVLTLAYPLKQYFAQRGDIQQLERERDQLGDRVDDLTDRDRLLSDPDYLRAQARERFGYVMPGDKLYVVIGPDSGDDSGPDVTPAPDFVPDDSWYTRLWGTVRTADAE